MQQTMSNKKTEIVWKSRNSIQRQAYVAKRVAATAPHYINNLQAGDQTN